MKRNQKKIGEIDTVTQSKRIQWKNHCVFLEYLNSFTEKQLKKSNRKKYKVLRFVSKRIEQMTNFSVVTFRDDQ